MYEEDIWDRLLEVGTLDDLYDAYLAYEMNSMPVPVSVLRLLDSVGYKVEGLDEELEDNDG